MDESEETDDSQLFFHDSAQEQSQFFCSVFPVVCRIVVVSFLAIDYEDSSINNVQWIILNSFIDNFHPTK